MNQTAMMARQMQNRFGAGNNDKLLQYWFGYSADTGTTLVAQNASVTVNTNIQADSDFLVQQLIVGSSSATMLATPTINENIFATMQITDTGSGQNLFDQPQFVRNVAGSAQLPYILPVPRLFKANSTIQWTITNLGALSTRFFLTYSGQKLYDNG